MFLEEVQTLEGHFGRVWACSWSPSGKILATCGEDTNIRLWSFEGGDGDGKSGKWVCQTILTEAHTRTVRFVSWSPCGRFLTSASFDGTVAVWNRKSGQFECSATLEGHENEVKCAAFSKSGVYLASCSRDKSVWIWDVDDEEDDYSCMSVLQAHTQDVKKVVWHPHEDILISCSYDNRIKLYKEDDDDWICVATLAAHDSTVWSASFDKTGKRIASCSDDKTVRIWQEYPSGNSEGIVVPQDRTSTWKCVCTIAGDHTRCIFDIDWCKNTDMIVTACGDNAIRIFSEDTNSSCDNAVKFTLRCKVESAHSEDVNCVAWNPKENGLLASASDDGNVKLWKIIKESDDLI